MRKNKRVVNLFTPFLIFKTGGTYPDWLNPVHAAFNVDDGTSGHEPFLVDEPGAAHEPYLIITPHYELTSPYI